VLLYHGTSERHLESICGVGIQPRKIHQITNWKHSSQSHAGAVYLTDAYPLYFAWNASEDGRLAIIEIDSTDLTDDLCADEDVVEQANRGRDQLSAKWSIKQRTAHYRRMIHQYSWETSLQLMGTCAHMGTIPVTAIKRIALVDRSTFRNMLMRGYDPTICLANYRFVGARYRDATKWVFDPEQVTIDVIEMMGQKITITPIPDSREGIQIITPHMRAGIQTAAII
jgi:hypothetical protein